jgi:hypothetical protein
MRRRTRFCWRTGASTAFAARRAPQGVDALVPDPIPIERLETIVPLVIAPLDSTEEQRRYE